MAAAILLCPPTSPTSSPSAHLHARYLHQPKPVSALTPTLKEPKLEPFVCWLTDNGLLPKSRGVARVETVPEGLGLVAQRGVSAGEEVLRVPKDFWISVDTVNASDEVGKYCQGRKPWVLLALFLLYEKFRPKSAWRPYLDILPERLDSPLFWSDDELSELQGTQLLGSTLGYRQYVGSEYRKLRQEVILPNPGVFEPSIFTEDAFLWAFGILRSRTFPPLTGDDLALVPFADLVNHGLTLPVMEPSWERKVSGFLSPLESLIVRAPVIFKAGDQVVMEYGKKKSNGTLALDYGFVDITQVNTGIRDGFVLTLEIPESDCFFEDKLDVAELNGLNTTTYFDLVRGQDPPENMLAFLRLIALSGPDAFLLEALFRDSVWEHMHLPVSSENEEAVCQGFLDGCRSTLAGYPTTISEDLSLLENGHLSSRLEMAIVVRLGEKQVLKQLQQWFESQMARLNQLEYYAERRLRSLGLTDEKGNTIPWDASE